MVYTTVFPNSDNEIILTIVNASDLSDPNFPKGKPIDFINNGVTLIELNVACINFTSTDGVITFADGGKITIKIGNSIDLASVSTEIEHNSTIKVYDPAHINGQYLVHPRMTNSNLTILVVDTCD